MLSLATAGLLLATALPPSGEALMQELVASYLKTGEPPEARHSEVCTIEEARLSPQTTQYVHNATYAWATVSDSHGACIYMFSPLQRALTAKEATVFLLAAGAMPLSDEQTQPNEGQLVAPQPSTATGGRGAMEIEIDPKEKEESD